MDMLRVLFVSILWNVVSSAKSDCVDDYLHFEKLTFSNNSENRLKLYQAFYPINKHLPYSVVVTYQTGSSNGTRRNISTDSSCPNEQVWMWLSSPVFLFAEPTLANRLTLYALNYFEDWHPQQLLINIPTPCEGNAEELLKQMTRSLQACALNEHMNGQDLAYVDHGCGTDITNVKLTANADIKFNAKVIVAMVGLFIMTIFVQLSSIIMVRVILHPVAQRTLQYSYEHYGNFWGTTTTLCASGFVAAIFDSRTLAIQIIGGKLGVHMYYMYVCVLIPTITLVFNVPVAIYVALKVTFAAPSIYLLSAKLLCCCSKKRAQVLLTALLTWACLCSIQLLLSHVVAGLLFLPVAPFAIVTYALLIILILTCVSHLLALLFTIAASACTPQQQRHTLCISFIPRALVLIPLLIAVICFGVLLAFSGTFVNTSTKQDSFLVSFKSIFVPVFLASMSFGLKAFIAGWLKWSPEAPEIIDSPLESLPDDLMIHP